MADTVRRSLAGSLVLLHMACSRPSRPETTGVAGAGASPGQNPSAAGERLRTPDTEDVMSGPSGSHPALGGHPPSYWHEQGQAAASPEAPVPGEAWGGRFRYRTHIRGAIGTICLCQDRGGACEAGAVVRGLTWASVPWARTVNGQLEASVELIGVLSSGALTLTEPPRQPPAVNEAETLTLFPLPCETPAQGWQIRDLRRVGRQDEQAAVTYAEHQAEHAATWIHWDPSLSRAERARSSSQKGVLVFTFTENLEAHRHRLEQLWGGPLCVATGELTREAQSGIVAHAADLLRREGRRQGMLCGTFSVSSEISSGSNGVSVSGLAWDAAKLSRWLSHGLAGFPVDIKSPLVAEPAP
ncbi:MAG TPA: hypothetical protein VJV79_35435 [Polyangiaceae bacterium]|nr:hypothetical protein [Polyangiaceae bacterium]